MNKIFNYLSAIFLLTGVVFLSACDDEEEGPAAPSISINSQQDISNGEFTGFVSDTLFLGISANTPGGFQSMEVLVDGVRDTIYNQPADVGNLSFSADYYYALQAVENITLSFQVLDETGQVEVERIQVMAEAKPTRVYTAVLLAAPTQDLTSETFFSTNSGEVYTVNDVITTNNPISAQIDFGYYYGGTGLATLSSPAAYPADVYDLADLDWQNLNQTLLKRTALPVSQYLENENNVEFIEQTFTNATFGSNQGRVTELNIGEILAFQLDAVKSAKHGLIRVLDIEAGQGLGDFIEIEIIVVD
ncbi:MAG: hypothetical protein ACNS62_16775 [Candidatus Cyclobacteriaceae bacterium M3_2C_046]